MKSQELTPQEILIAEGIASKAQDLQETLLNQQTESHGQVIELITTAGAKALNRIDDVEISQFITSNLITALALSNVDVLVRNQLAIENRELELRLSGTAQVTHVEDDKIKADDVIEGLNNLVDTETEV